MPVAAAVRWERPVPAAAAVRSVAPSAVWVAGRLPARPAAAVVVRWEERSAAAARWEQPVPAAAAEPSMVPLAVQVAARLPAHPADAAAVPWVAQFVAGVAARSERPADGGARHAVPVRSRAAAAGSAAARSKARVAAGCCWAAGACCGGLLLGGRRLRRRTAAAIGRTLLAAFLRGWCGPSLLSRWCLWRGWSSLRLRTLSRRSRWGSGWRRLSWGWWLWGLGARRRGRRLRPYLRRRRRPGLRCRWLSGLFGCLRRGGLRHDERPIERCGKTRRRQRNRQQRSAGQQQRADVQADRQAWIHDCAGSGLALLSE